MSGEVIAAMIVSCMPCFIPSVIACDVAPILSASCAHAESVTAKIIAAVMPMDMVGSLL